MIKTFIFISAVLYVLADPNQTQLLTHPRGLFSISNCESTYIPQIILIILISLGVISIPTFFCIEKYRFKQAIKTYATSYKPDLQSMQSFDKKEYQNIVFTENAHNEIPLSSLASQHLILSLKKSSNLERLKIILVYINSLIIQLGLILFLFKNKRHNYFNSAIIALIASSVSGVFSYIVFALKVDSPVFKKLIYFMDFAFSIACACNIFIKDLGCIENYWLYSYAISIVFDLFVVQSSLVFIRKAFVSICGGSQVVDRIET